MFVTAIAHVLVAAVVTLIMRFINIFRFCGIDPVSRVLDLDQFAIKVRSGRFTREHMQAWSVYESLENEFKCQTHTREEGSVLRAEVHVSESTE